MYYKATLFVFIFFNIWGCQPTEIFKPIVFDNSNFNKISINAKEIQVKNKYEQKFSDTNIENNFKNPPIVRIESWIQDNINNFGNENIFVINVLDASINRKEIINENAKKLEEKTIYIYEVFILVEYELYDNSNYLIANTTVESFRTSTSKKYISINETQEIIDEIIFNSIKDFTNESHLMIREYMGQYLVD